MRLLLSLAVLALVAAIPVGAEDTAAEAVKWSWQVVPEDARPGDEAELVLSASIAPQWVVYSSDFKAELGPQPTRLKTRPQAAVELIDGLRSVGAERKKDQELNIEYGYFSGRAELRQRVRLPADGSPVEALLVGQACHEADGTCHLIRQDVRVNQLVAHGAAR